MAEPTQGNPTPPNNQDGLVPPVGDERAYNLMKKFADEMADLEKLVAKSNETLKKNEVLQKKVLDATKKEVSAKSQLDRETNALAEETKKYRDEQGKWKTGTEAIQRKYEDDLISLQKIYEDVVEDLEDQKVALKKNNEQLSKEKDERMTAIFALRELRDSIKEVDAATGALYTKEYGKIGEIVQNVNTAAIASSDGMKSVQSEVSEMLRKQNQTAAAEKAAKAFEAAAEAAEKKAKVDKEAAEELAEKKEKAGAYVREIQAKQLATKFEMSGGIVGLSDLKDQIDQITESADKNFKILNPKATEAEVRKNREKVLIAQQQVMIDNIMTKQQKELKTVQEERIKKIMEEKKVSKETAAKLADTKANREEDAKQISKNKQIVESLKSIDKNQLSVISRMDKDSIKAAEREAEAANDTPAWAQKLIDTTSLLGDKFGGMFKKEDGWFKTILLILTVAVGAVLGYIWTKIQFIVTLLTMLPFGIGKAIGTFFGSIGKGAAGLFGGVAKIFEPFTKGLGSILKFFPGLSGSLGQFGKAFSFGFKVLGKFFFYVQLAIDAIYGAYKGFQQLGNIKGLIMGALAQMISGLTFGLLDFQSIFDFFNTTMGGVFDGIAGVFEPIVQFFGKAYDNLTDAFSRVMAVFQGEGSIFSKIFKVIQIGITTTVKNMVALIGAAIKTVYNAVIVLPFKIGEFIGEMLVKLAELTYDAFMSLWDWISSGQILADVVNFGTWLYDELIGFFAGIINAIADGLGEIPIVGGYIKEALGGGAGGDGLEAAVEKSAEVVKEAQQSADTMATQSVTPTQSGAVQFVNAPVTPIATPSGKVQFAAPSYNASTINNATTSTATAKMEASNQGGTAVINTPTTNNVISGGGGESNVLMPTNNRNTEPTFRALLFQDCPAL